MRVPACGFQLFGERKVKVSREVAAAFPTVQSFMYRCVTSAAACDICGRTAKRRPVGDSAACRLVCVCV